jgi:hypothetical protein
MADHVHSTTHAARKSPKLARDPLWKTLYSDKRAVVFVRAAESVPA